MLKHMPRSRTGDLFQKLDMKTWGNLPEAPAKLQSGGLRSQSHSLFAFIPGTPKPFCFGLPPAALEGSASAFACFVGGYTTGLSFSSFDASRQVIPRHQE